jgi:hypothetical protein
VSERPAENDRFYLFWRGGTGRPVLALSDDGEEWVLGGTFISTGGRRPHVVVASDDVDEIRIAYTDGHPEESSRNGIYYLNYKDAAFYRADGSKICDIWELPVTPGQCDVVYDGESWGDGWVWDIAFDQDGEPVMVYARFPSLNDHHYWYARWRDGEWVTANLTAGGPAFPRKGRNVYHEEYYSGGITIDGGDPNAVYLSREVAGVYEIERCVTADRGETWRSQPLKQGSSEDNVRPAVPLYRRPGDPAVLWMAGIYCRYDVFGTNIRYAGGGLERGRP